MECGRRPSRSDVHLSEEEEAKVEAEARQHFQEIAPHRHTKPNRSDNSSSPYTDALPVDSIIPENIQFQRLQQALPQNKAVDDGSHVLEEEFVETAYYDDLNCVDKHHHTTGTGFIKVKEDNKCFTIEPDPSASQCHSSSTGNPATNDWIPKPAPEVSKTSKE